MQPTHNTKRLEQAISSQEMRLFEKNEFLKKESYFFMKNAGRQVFNLIRKNFKNKQPIIVLCGPGNNGGDGFIIAKYLKSYGYKTEVYASSNKKSYKGDALKALTEYEGKIKKISSFRIRKNALIVDALFGIGLTRSIKGILKKVIIKLFLLIYHQGFQRIQEKYWVVQLKLIIQLLFIPRNWVILLIREKSLVENLR